MGVALVVVKTVHGQSTTPPCARGGAQNARESRALLGGTPIAHARHMGQEPAVYYRDLFVRHHRWVRAVARRRFGIETADADEVVQKVFMVAYGALQTQSVKAERAWLSAITRRVCANERRNLRLRREMEAQYCVSTSHAGPEVRLWANDIVRALSKLDSKQRELVDLTCFEGLSLYGAAGRLGLSLRVAETRLQSAKTTLCRHLDGAVPVNPTKR